jgi:nucleoside-diphosphate kinase
MQDSYMMVKPEAVEAGRVGAILEMVERNGFRIQAVRTLTLSQARAERFYEVHRDRPFYADLVRYITGGPVVGVHLRREDAVKRLRELVGATNPREAACGTIRFLYGSSLQENAVHASDSPENAKRELSLIFGEAN